MMSSETERLLSTDQRADRDAALNNDPDSESLSPHLAPTYSIYSPAVRGQYGAVTSDQEDTSGNSNDMDETDDVIMEHGLTASTDREAHTTSNLQSLMHLLKGNVGTGILALPIAIKYAGLWVGTIGIMLIGMIALHCMHLLVRSSRHMCLKTGRPNLDYGGVGKKAIEHYIHDYYPREKRIYIGKTTKVVINTFLCITQLGFCTVYILFIAQNITQVVHAASSGFTLNIRMYEFIIFLLLIPFVFVRKLTHLAPFSMMANVLTVVGLIITIQYCFRGLPPASDYPAFNSWEQLPLYFGIAIYAFEGIGIVLPIENKMKHPQDFPGWNGVLSTGVYLVIILYIAVGFFGYMKFGDSVQGSITLDLPQDDWLYLSAKLMFSIGIYISYGLQFYVPILVMWTGIRRKLTNVWLLEHGEILLRLSFLILTFLLAISIPHLDLMISLIGAMASSALALIFPPIIDFLAFWPDGEMRIWQVVKNILIILFGLLGFFAGTITTVKQIITVMHIEK